MRRVRPHLEGNSLHRDDAWHRPGALRTVLPAEAAGVSRLNTRPWQRSLDGHTGSTAVQAQARSASTACNDGPVITIEPLLHKAIATSSGAVQLEVRDSPRPELVEQGFQAARRALLAIPHPEEPDEPLPSAVSVRLGPRSPRLVFDIADAEAEPGLIETVVQRIVDALNGAGVDGTLVAASGEPGS